MPHRCRAGFDVAQNILDIWFPIGYNQDTALKKNREDDYMRERKSIDEQIAILDEKINKATERLKSLKAARSDLIEKKESVGLQEIYNILQEKGISASDAVAILRNAQVG